MLAPVCALINHHHPLVLNGPVSVHHHHTIANLNHNTDLDPIESHAANGVLKNKTLIQNSPYRLPYMSSKAIPGSDRYLCHIAIYRG